MVRFVSVTFLLGWLLCAWAMWIAMVHDAATGIQFAFLNGPATALLLLLAIFSTYLAE
jgi:hypothetical protein